MARASTGVAEIDSHGIRELGNVSVDVQKKGDRSIWTVRADHPRDMLQKIGFAFYHARSLDLEPSAEGDLTLISHPVRDIEVSSLIQSPLVIPVRIRVGDTLRVGSSGRPDRRKKPSIYFSNVIWRAQDFKRS